jgi:hypothetical protein
VRPMNLQSFVGRTMTPTPGMHPLGRFPIRLSGRFLKLNRPHAGPNGDCPPGDPVKAGPRTYVSSANPPR